MASPLLRSQTLTSLGLSPTASQADILEILTEEVTQALDIDTWRTIVQHLLHSPTFQDVPLQGLLMGLIQGSKTLFPSFQLHDFISILQLCERAKYIPDREWLCSMIYEDTGGIERFYKKV